MHIGTRAAGLVLALAMGATGLVGSPSASADLETAAQGTDSHSSRGALVAPFSSEDGDSPDCVVCGAPVKRAVKVSGPVLVSKKFVRHLTGAWARSSGYSWSSSTTVGATVSSGLGVTAAGASSNIGVTASVTKSYSITVNIPASSSRYSKLGLASNFSRYYIKSAWHQDGKPVAGATWTYGYLYSPTRDQFLIVYYQ